jgi:hypothetical protein
MCPFLKICTYFGLCSHFVLFFGYILLSQYDHQGHNAQKWSTCLNFREFQISEVSLYFNFYSFR